MTRSLLARRAALVAVAAVAAAIVVPSVTGGTGAGATFHLGRTNSVNKATTLTGATGGKMLQVTNTGDGTALSLTTDSDVAPMRVSSSTKVANLNADQLDGLDGSAFLQSEGQVVITSPPTAWLFTNGAAPITLDFSALGYVGVARSAAGYNYLRVDAEVPSVQYGRRLRLLAVETCYQASANATLSDVLITVHTSTSDPVGTSSQVLADQTDRTDAACRTYSPASPIDMTAGRTIVFRLGVDWASATSFYAGRTTFIYEATSDAGASLATSGKGVVVLEPRTGPEREEDVAGR